MEKTLSEKLPIEPGKMEHLDKVQGVLPAKAISVDGLTYWQKFYYGLGLVATVMAILFILYFVYLFFYPVRTIEYQKEPFLVINKQVQQGQDLIYEASLCKYFEGVGSISFKFIDTIVYSTSPVESNLPLGCHIFRRAVTIPSHLPPGDYQLAVTVRYNINPLRTIEKTALTEHFTVIEAEE